MNTEAIINDFKPYSQNWINNFNAGNIQACIDAYTENASMCVKDVGDFHGKAAISAFWKELTQKAKHIAYHETNIEVINETTVHLSSGWKMNIAEGIITLEEWVKQSDGTWKLTQDAFEIHKQY